MEQTRKCRRSSNSSRPIYMVRSLLVGIIFGTFVLAVATLPSEEIISQSSNDSYLEEGRREEDNQTREVLLNSVGRGSSTFGNKEPNEELLNTNSTDCINGSYNIVFKR